jgi:hypothetical protein
MDARFGYYDNGVTAKFIKYINSSGAVVSNSSLPTATQNLVKIRARAAAAAAARPRDFLPADQDLEGIPRSGQERQAGPGSSM